jgi:hypothetical protein
MTGILAALISGGVALVVGVLTVLVTQGNTRRQLAIEADKRDIEAGKLTQAREDLEARVEALRQSQIIEIVKKRIDTYPYLYRVIADYGRNWKLRGKLYDNDWASRFLEELITCNAKYGVFFSDDVYIAYSDLRTLLEDIRTTTSPSGSATDEQIAELYSILRNKYKGGRGLGTIMKDDVGGFLLGALSARRLDQQLRGEWLTDEYKLGPALQSGGASPISPGGATAHDAD